MAQSRIDHSFRYLEGRLSSVLFGPIASVGVGISERTHVFFSATSELPNREQRIFIGSDQTRS